MIKVFEYMESDIDSMTINHWARILKNKKNLRNIKAYLKSAHSYTLFDDKHVAILAFNEYDKGMYDACIIADVSFADNPKYAIKMRWLIHKLMEVFNMKRLQTTSEDDPKLNKWHEFLGAKMEKKDSDIIKGVHYNLWSM